MSEDPIKKIRIYQGFNDVVPKSQGVGKIDTGRDFSANFNSTLSRTFFLCLCALPYVGICIFLYLEGLEILSIIVLATPLLLFSLFWFLKRKLDN